LSTTNSTSMPLRPLTVLLSPQRGSRRDLDTILLAEMLPLGMLASQLMMRCISNGLLKGITPTTAPRFRRSLSRTVSRRSGNGMKTTSLPLKNRTKMAQLPRISPKMRRRTSLNGTRMSTPTMTRVRPKMEKATTI